MNVKGKILVTCVSRQKVQYFLSKDFDFCCLETSSDASSMKERIISSSSCDAASMRKFSVALGACVSSSKTS